MELYSSNEHYKLYYGNMLDMSEVIEPNTIDAVITDPPYGLTSITKRFGKEDSAECQYGKDGSFQRLSKGFMGKEWDGSGIEYNVDAWRKCYEVLKPGGYLLAFGGSRTFHRIACAIEDAGFEIRDTIMWLYGSGFPKSMDISKNLDKRNGRNPNIDFKEYLNMKRKEKSYSLADINKMMNVATNGGGFASSIMGEKENIILPTKENYLKLKEILDLDNRYDELINTSEAEREVIGKQQYTNSKKFFEYDGKRVHLDITIPSTDLAKKWQGWGTALKPSYEPIIVARKPFKGSLVDNVIENGVGGINIDECRVETQDELRRTIGGWNNKYVGGENIKPINTFDLYPNGLVGRFPANTILTYDDTDFDEVCGEFPNTNPSRQVIGGANRKTQTKEGIISAGGWKKYNRTKKTEGYNDNGGSASRYFYCAKASKKDRDEGLDIKEQVITDGRNKPIDNAFNRGETLRKNIHPTVKPTELMQYLVRLVCPEGATILDPFNGSGSTGKAVMYENKERNKNYKYIGIELTEEYLPISKARIEHLIDISKEESREGITTGQTSIFDFIGE